MAQYKCLKPSTNGRRGEIITLTDSHRTKQLIKMGIIEAYNPEKSKATKVDIYIANKAQNDKSAKQAAPSKKKGGKSAQDANPKEKVETK